MITLPANARGPVLKLTLPETEFAVSVILRNVTTGKSLTIAVAAFTADTFGGSGNFGGAGNFGGLFGGGLVLDFFRRTIRDQTGADRSALLDPIDNELWTSEPLVSGANEISIEFHSASAKAYAAKAILLFEKGHY